jgi:hypothetical protein
MLEIMRAVEFSLPITSLPIVSVSVTGISINISRESDTTDSGSVNDEGICYSKRYYQYRDDDGDLVFGRY